MNEWDLGMSNLNLLTMISRKWPEPAIQQNEGLMQGKAINLDSMLNTIYDTAKSGPEQTAQKDYLLLFYSVFTIFNIEQQIKYKIISDDINKNKLSSQL